MIGRMLIVLLLIVADRAGADRVAAAALLQEPELWRGGAELLSSVLCWPVLHRIFSGAG